MLVLQKLKDLADEDYKAFNRKIILTEQTQLGVRMPALRKIARQIAKKDAMTFIESDKRNIYEMILLEGIVLSYLDKTFEELLPLTEIFLKKVDSWAQVDTTVPSFKNIGKEKEYVLTVIKKWLKSDKEFFVRAGLIILLAHYIQNKNLNMIFALSQSVTHSGYYVHMGNAWLISVCMAKFPDETIAFFKNNTLDKDTHNKAIQKSCESYRVSREHKAVLRELKRK